MKYLSIMLLISLLLMPCISNSGITGTLYDWENTVVTSVNPYVYTFDLTPDGTQLVNTAPEGSGNTSSGNYSVAYSDSGPKLVIFLYYGELKGRAKLGGGYVTTTEPGPIIIDYTCRNETLIPEVWLTAIKGMNVVYTGESHGRQIPCGLELLETEKQPSTYFNVTVYDSSVGLTETVDFDMARTLRLHSGIDYWGSTTVDITAFWSTETGIDNVKRTLTYYEDNDITIDAIVHTWCWDLRTYTEEGVNTYLSTMESLETWMETNAPNTTLVYMTDTDDDSTTNSEDYNRWQRNTQIRNYCIANNKVLFDFGGLETYGTDGVLNTFSYNGENVPVWDTDWSSGGYYDCPDNGTTHINQAAIIMKAKAFWWLMARIGGWNP